MTIENISSSVAIRLEKLKHCGAVFRLNFLFIYLFIYFCDSCSQELRALQKLRVIMSILTFSGKFPSSDLQTFSNIFNKNASFSSLSHVGLCQYQNMFKQYLLS